MGQNFEINRNIYIFQYLLKEVVGSVKKRMSANASLTIQHDGENFIDAKKMKNCEGNYSLLYFY